MKELRTMRLLRGITIAAIAATAMIGLAPHGSTPRVAAQTVTGADLVGVTAAGSLDALRQAGVSWYLTFGFGGGGPTDLNRASVVRLTPAPALSDLLDAVKSRPGSAWIIGNEPNVPTEETSDNLSPAAYATRLHDLEARIHSADSTAIIVGPSVLNWVDTCGGCAGYTRGQDWTQQFYDSYVSTYGVRPPIDRWAIHTYELDWGNTPTLHTDFDKRQLTALRAWLDAIPAEAGMPIWDTELGFHWAFAGWKFDAQNKLVPVGDYDEAGVQKWMNEMLTWLISDGLSLGVERSFLYGQAPPSEGFTTLFGGLALFKSGAADASLTPAGQMYVKFLQATSGGLQTSSFLGRHRKR